MTKKQLFETYITENLDRIYRFAYTYTKNQQDAEDVVNESVVKALKAIDTLKSKEYMGTWFYRIVINTALSHLRTQNKIVYLDMAEAEAIAGKGDDYADLSFEQMIDILEPKYKSIVVLRFFEGMTLSEIAEILEENLNTVKTRLYRALGMLRIEMEDIV